MRELAELAAARDALEPRRVTRALAETFERWRAPGSPERARLAREHGVHSPEVVERGVKLALAGWTEESLTALRARELSEPCWVPPVTAVWLAGSIPTAAFSALSLPLLAGSAVYAKPAAADPVSARLFAASLAETDPAVGAALGIGSDAKALDDADAVVAHGSDATIALLRARVGPGRPFIGYGHKLSLAAIGPAIEPLVAARRLALDVALWDGRGCLSPAWALVSDSPRGRAAELAHALAVALEEIDETLPRGALEAAESADLLELRARAAVREGTRLELAAATGDWSSAGSILADVRAYVVEAAVEADEAKLVSLPCFADRFEGRAAAANGAIDRAIEMLTAASDGFEALEAPYERARTDVDLARALAATGRIEEAGTRAATAAKVFASLGAVKDLAVARRSVGTGS